MGLDATSPTRCPSAPGRPESTAAVPPALGRDPTIEATVTGGVVRAPARPAARRAAFAVRPATCRWSAPFRRPAWAVLRRWPPLNAERASAELRPTARRSLTDTNVLP